jgi:hypothetical protein
MQKRKRIMFRVLTTDLGGDNKKKLFFVILEFPAKIPRDRYSNYKNNHNKDPKIKLAIITPPI